MKHECNVKNEKMLWALSACALVLLFLMSSTNLIIKEKRWRSTLSP